VGGNKSRGGLEEYNGCGWYEWNSGPGKEYSNTGREKTSSETQNDTRGKERWPSDKEPVKKTLH